MTTPSDDVFEIYDYEIEGGVFDGGGGRDTLVLAGGGYFNFSKAATFTNIEVVQGSAASDRIFLNGAQLAGIEKIDGGGTNWAQRWDDWLLLQGRSINLTGKTITNFGSILLQDDGTTLTVDNLSLALEITARFADNDSLVLQNTTLTADQRIELLNRGFDNIVDSTGVMSVNSSAQLTGLNGDRVVIQAGKSFRLDVGGNATLSDDRGAIQSLKVSLPFNVPDTLGLSAYEKIRLTATDRVKFGASSVFANERSVSVDGIEIGTYNDYLPASTGLQFRFNVNATPERVTEVLRAITYQVTGTSLYAVGDRNVEIRITDYGGRVTTATVVLANPSGNNVLKGGIGRDTLDGKAGNDRLYGENGNDVLKGGTGDDQLCGGAGNDKLYGQSGRDTYLFDTKLNKKTNVDLIGDFSTRDDTIRLENAIFKKLKKTGTLKADFFTLGPKANDKNDYIIYDRTKGYLYYDADGSGAGKAVLFAKLKANLDHTDLYVI